MTRPIPQLYALVPCDTAFQQAGSGKWFVVGTFHGFGIPQVPVQLPPFMLFLSLGDFSGNQSLQIRVTEPEGGELCCARGHIPTMDIGTFEIAFPIPSLRMDREGAYGIELSAGGQVLGQRALDVKIQAMPPMA